MVFVEILKTICVFFDWLIYSIVVNCYVLFAAMCEMNVDTIGEKFVLLTDRIKVFFGIIMLFIVAFNLLQMLIDPDKAEGEASKLIQKIAVSIVLLISMNFVFGLFSELQNIIIRDNVIESIIFGQSGKTISVTAKDENGEVIASTGNYAEYVQTGKFFSYNLLFAFITVPDTLKAEIMGSATKTPSKTLYDLIGEINKDNVYYRYPVISGICGIFMGVIFVTYAIEVGIRAFSLMLLQVIAPIPIIAYITPKGKDILDKYLKEYVSTFISLFLKIFIIFITLYLMQFAMGAILPTLEGNASNVLFPNMAEAGNFFKALLFVAVMFSLFYFSKKFTKMLENIFGLKFDSDINPFKAAGGIVKGAIGGAIGGFVGGAAAIGTGAGVLGGLGAAAKGLGAGASSGAKAKGIKDFVSGSVGKNFTSQRKGSIDLGNKGGVGGAMAQKLNTANERKIAQAKSNLEVINKGKEYREGLDKKMLKRLGYASKEDYVSRDTGYIGAEEKLKNLRETNGSAVDIQAAMVDLNAKKKDAERVMKAQINNEVGNTLVGGQNEDGYFEASQYINYGDIHKNVYGKDAPTFEKSSGTFIDMSKDRIEAEQNQTISKASTSNIAVSSAKAQAAGAENAAKHSGGGKK